MDSGTVLPGYVAIAVNPSRLILEVGALEDIPQTLREAERIMADKNLFLAVALGLIAGGPNLRAAGSGELHTGQYTFIFGNHIDTHQETKVEKDGSLKGRFYIYFTGETDEASGHPVARHPRGAGHNEECGVDSIDCVVGWEIRAIRSEAKFLSQSGVSGDDHPV